MMEYLRRKRIEAAAEIEIAKNKLSCILYDPKNPEQYDHWTAELVVAMRKHRSIVVMAKRQAREERIAAGIRTASARLKKEETEHEKQTGKAPDREGNHSVLQPA